MQGRESQFLFPAQRPPRHSKGSRQTVVFHGQLPRPESVVGPLGVSFRPLQPAFAADGKPTDRPPQPAAIRGLSSDVTEDKQ